LFGTAIRSCYGWLDNYHRASTNPKWGGISTDAHIGL
jgi:hypothetical protein